jgi:hypothetical protein
MDNQYVLKELRRYLQVQDRISHYQELVNTYREEANLLLKNLNSHINQPPKPNPKPRDVVMNLVSKTSQT